MLIVCLWQFVAKEFRKLRLLDHEIGKGVFKMVMLLQRGLKAHYQACRGCMSRVLL
jgi:hypothetical protein